MRRPGIEGPRPTARPNIQRPVPRVVRGAPLQTALDLLGQERARGCTRNLLGDVDDLLGNREGGVVASCRRFTPRALNSGQSK